MKYIPETNIHLTVRVEGVPVEVPQTLTDNEVIQIYNAAFSIVKEKLGTNLQYALINNKIITERSITTSDAELGNHTVNCSFYWEKEYELSDDINNFKSVEMHLTNRIMDDMKKLESDKRFEWVYPRVKNVRFILPQVEQENSVEEKV